MGLENIIIYAIVAVMFIIVGILVLWAYINSKGKYDEYIEPLDEKDFRMKAAVPMGLYINEKIDFVSKLPNIIKPFFGRYNNEIFGRIVEIYGPRYGKFYFTVHNAGKCGATILGFFIPLCISIISCMQSDFSNATTFLIGAPLLAGLMFYVTDKGLNDKIDERRLKIQLEFPEFINKLLILVNAGMTISRAWEKIVTDNKKKNPLYDELNMSLAEIRAGKSEAVAYEEFGRRCKIREVIKFVSVIVLNLRLGGASVAPTLKAQAEECWEMRRAAAKQLGEQASTKALLPMAIMLFGIIIIVVLPAIMQIQN